MKTECQSEYFGFGGKTYPCPLSVAMDLVGGKWKAVILYHLQGGAKRFGELHECLPGITETILSRLLKQLEHDGLMPQQSLLLGGGVDAVIGIERGQIANFDV